MMRLGVVGWRVDSAVQAVKRNLDRFPADFMFQLTSDEHKILRSQTVTSRSWGGRRYPPYAFTEQGVAMLSSVLRSPFWSHRKRTCSRITSDYSWGPSGIRATRHSS